jgi:hypothetical protein
LINKYSDQDKIRWIIASGAINDHKKDSFRGSYNIWVSLWGDEIREGRSKTKRGG